MEVLEKQLKPINKTLIIDFVISFQLLIFKELSSLDMTSININKLLLFPVNVILLNKLNCLLEN